MSESMRAEKEEEDKDEMLRKENEIDHATSRSFSVILNQTKLNT